jgi:hypothetical protein
MHAFLGNDSPGANNASVRRNDGYDRVFPRPSKDDFGSKGGSYIKLGNHKSNAASPDKRAFNSTLITHESARPSETAKSLMSDTGKSMMQDSGLLGQHVQNSGIHNTKFGLGFQRRRENDVKNPAADEKRMHMQETAHRTEAMRAQRKVDLYKNIEKNGFNLITGAPKPNIVPPQERDTGKRSIIPEVSKEVAANSRVFLRESGGRFFMPHATGVKHEYRQKILVEGGMAKPCMSGVLMPGKADLKSDGIEDNFSRSRYPASQPEPGYKRTDLPDTRAPGKYTPRKQTGNPSANPELVKHWGSGMDINNKALRGLV